MKSSRNIASMVAAGALALSMAVSGVAPCASYAEEQPAQEQVQACISAEEAEDAALADRGVSRDEARELRSILRDSDEDGVHDYKVTYRAHNADYTYPV